MKMICVAQYEKHASKKLGMKLHTCVSGHQYIHLVVVVPVSDTVRLKLLDRKECQKFRPWPVQSRRFGTR